MHVKDKTPRDKQCDVVYGLKCSDAGCDESYVGETKQSIKTRFNQHRRGSSNEKIRTLLSLPTPNTQATNSTVKTLSFWTKKKSGLREG